MIGDDERGDEAPEPVAPEDETAAPSAVEPSEAAVEPVDPADPVWVQAEIDELDGKLVEDLQARASERGVVGYSSMNKNELVKAITKSLRDNPPPEPRIGQSLAVFIGQREDGGWEIEAPEQELRDFVCTIQDAIEEGEAEGILLTPEGTNTMTVVCSDES